MKSATELKQQADMAHEDELRTDVFDSIEVFYNRKRRHSTLGRRASADYEKVNHPTPIEEQPASSDPSREEISERVTASVDSPR